MTFSKYYYYILDSDTKIKVEKTSRENVHKNEKTTSKMTCIEFIICFHQFVSRIFSMNLSQFEQLKKENKVFIIGPKRLSPFVIWKRKHNKYSLKNPDSEFKTGETI